ncbi:DUF3017 domain-containing protein [Streptomyces sp. NPDC055078]
MGVRMNDDREVGEREDPEAPEGASAAPAVSAAPGAPASPGAPVVPGAPDAASGNGSAPQTPPGTSAAPETTATAKTPSRRPPSLTTDTARPEGGGRAAPGGAPAPARQWPLLTVLALTGLGLVIVGLDPFAEAFRIGTILIGVALVTGGVLRWVLPSVGMLAVRSRFTDLITYGLLGTAVTVLALVAQPDPWLELPFLEDIVRVVFRDKTGETS